MYSPAYNQIENRAECSSSCARTTSPLLVTGTGGALHGSHLPVLVHERESKLVA